MCTSTVGNAVLVVLGKRSTDVNGVVTNGHDGVEEVRLTTLGKRCWGGVVDRWSVDTVAAANGRTRTINVPGRHASPRGKVKRYRTCLEPDIRAPWLATNVTDVSVVGPSVNMGA